MKFPFILYSSLLSLLLFHPSTLSVDTPVRFSPLHCRNQNRVFEPLFPFSSSLFYNLTNVPVDGDARAAALRSRENVEQGGN
jgi:hypothetical protein